jgi:hypothetical protein
MERIFVEWDSVAALDDKEENKDQSEEEKQ